MSQDASESSAGSNDIELAGGSYDVIVARLQEQANVLKSKADTLNGHRTETFGSSALEVLGNERVRTENNCVPRDIVQVEGHLLFGYNVFLGLKTETRVEDVFNLHRFVQAEGGFDIGAASPEAAERGFLEDERFLREFAELHKFYKTAKLIRLSRNETKLLAVFQIGETHKDVRVFRWALAANSPPVYIDNRGEREHQFPPQHDFEWVECTRDDHVGGAFPHVSIRDKVFVETTGGDLTIKIENNTEHGEGIYSEPVDDPRQTINDANFAYAELGTLILLRVQPYNEPQARFLVFATRSHHVARIDSIGRACIQLPEDHGVVFPGGYFLQDGRYKVFDGDFSRFEFDRFAKSPNGEDVLYVFHEHVSGEYVLFSYNLIRKEVSTPIRCHGYSLFDDGRAIVFRETSPEPTRVHQMQIWQTPFVSFEFAAAEPEQAGFLGKVGNAELVRGISDALSIRRAIVESEPSRQGYEDLIAGTTRTIDAHHWLGHQEVGDLLSTLTSIRQTAELVIGEFEKVEAARERALSALVEAEDSQKKIIADLRPETWTEVSQFMDALSDLRRQRGQLIGLKELRFIDVSRLEELEADAVTQFNRISQDSLRFLGREDALLPLSGELETLLTETGQAEKTSEIAQLNERLEKIGEGVGVLSEVVASLKTDDPTERTAILESISEVYAQVNRVRATLVNRRKSLLSEEGRAEFAVQFQLFKQSVDSALTQAETPEACDDQLSRLMVQLEELEARFSEFDEFLADLTTKREEVYEVFTSKKQRLLDERQRRANNLMTAADRILSSVERRSQKFATADELNGFFASDPMVQKLQDMAESLVALGDDTRAGEVQSKLKSSRQSALRGLRDRVELFQGGAGLISFGRHKFAVNSQPLELTMVPDGEEMAVAITGTDFRERVTDEEFQASRPFWNQSLVSETPQVYRGEYLAASILNAAERREHGLSLDVLRQAQRSDSGLLGAVRKVAAERYDEGYERGIHDADAVLILTKILDLRDSAGLLRFGTRPRALACLFWAFVTDERRASWSRRAQSLGRLSDAFQSQSQQGSLHEDVSRALSDFGLNLGWGGSPKDSAQAASYLLLELRAEHPRFVVRAKVVDFVKEFERDLEERGVRTAFFADLEGLSGDLAAQVELTQAWLLAFGAEAASKQPERFALFDSFIDEALGILLGRTILEREPSSAFVVGQIEGLLGQHPRIVDQKMTLELDEFLDRLGAFERDRVPGYRAYRKNRAELIERERKRLRIAEFIPKTLTSFVRNRLINEVYLPLIGDNFAKQIGAAGNEKRTDLMGLLLLISPPGYGKTTLMEYVAGRLGLVFMKINGPALGHGVTSLDPAEAPNAPARNEVNKINLALEMGNNVMLYLDDIQHTHPELLQKFISVCDAQRRIEGIWNGQTRTYDLRGKRFCVVMAGNPYTEAGERFQIPDMLSNRADTYNLGDVLSGKEDAFALSYIENAVTSNSVLAPLAAREQSDIYKLVRLARGEDVATSSLSHAYSAAELDEIGETFRKLFQAQELLLQVNAEYIASASQDDKYRTEPPFKLQGSYRNMCKLAEKIVPAMNDQELKSLLADHYQGEAQTLTTGAEQNLLKLGELMGTLSPDAQARWDEIRSGFRKNQSLGGSEDDPVTRVTRQLGELSEQLQGIRGALGQIASKN